MMRGLLISAIYKRALEISTVAVDTKAAVTLMSADVETIQRGLRQFHDLWASVIEVGLATYLLQREVGYACMAPLLVVLRK